MRADAAPLVVVVGSLNVDHVIKLDRLPASGSTVIARDYRTVVGGKGANQAAAAALAGARVRMIGAVGMDPGGRRSITELEKVGIDIGGIERVPRVPTGSAFVYVTRDGRNSIAVVPGANASLDATRVEREFDRFGPKNGRIVVLLSLEIPLSAVEAAAIRAREHGAMVIVNPAPATALSPRLLGQVDVLTPNEDESSQVFGLSLDDTGRIDTREIPSLERGAIVVTLGERGAALVKPGRQREFRAPQVEPVDTTGAGDVFNGVLAARLANGMALEPSVAEAVHAASISTLFPGARVGAEFARALGLGGVG